MLEQQDGLFHPCPEVERAFPEKERPYFIEKEAVNTTTGQEVRVVFLCVVNRQGLSATQVYFCPWCGQQLGANVMAEGDKFKAELRKYREYRKRWVRQGSAGIPMGFAEWQQAANEFDEIEFLLRYAKHPHMDGLFRRKQALRDKLALGVILREPEQAKRE